MNVFHFTVFNVYIKNIRIILYVYTSAHIYLVCGNSRVSVLYWKLNCRTFSTKKCLKIHFENCWWCWTIYHYFHCLCDLTFVCVCAGLSFLWKSSCSHAWARACALKGALNTRTCRVLCAVHCVNTYSWVMNSSTQWSWWSAMLLLYPSRTKVNEPCHHHKSIFQIHRFRNRLCLNW